MRAYLLGTLEEESAAELERLYFTKPEFLEFVESVETQLIEDYLDGSLSGDVKRQFERHYLTTPKLRQRVQDLSRQRQPRWPVYLRLAASVLIVALLAAAWWFMRGHGPSPAAPPTVVIATLDLSPGVLKGAGIAANSLPLPARPGQVRLRLELPGQTAPLSCLVKISRATSDGGWNVVWSSTAPIASVQTVRGQWLEILLNAALVSPGDYLVRVSGPLEESYVFRVAPM